MKLKALTKAFDAVIGGFAVGERAWKGEHGQAVAMGLFLLGPLLWKKRLISMGLAFAAALIAYYFFEELHEREPVLAEVPVDAKWN